MEVLFRCQQSPAVVTDLRLESDVVHDHPNADARADLDLIVLTSCDEADMGKSICLRWIGLLIRPKDRADAVVPAIRLPHDADVPRAIFPIRVRNGGVDEPA